MQDLMDNRGLEEQPVLNTTAELCHAYVSLLMGRTDEVPVWLKNMEHTPTNLIFDGIGFTYIVAAVSNVHVRYNYNRELVAQAERK